MCRCWIPSSQGDGFNIVLGLLPGVIPRPNLRLVCDVHLDGIYVDTFASTSWDSPDLPGDSPRNRMDIAGILDESDLTLRPFCFKQRIFKGSAITFPHILVY